MASVSSTGSLFLIPVIQTFPAARGTSITVTLHNIKEPSATDRVSAVSSAVMSSSSHTSSLHSQDRVNSKSITQALQQVTESIMKISKELNVEKFDEFAKSVVLEYYKTCSLFFNKVKDTIKHIEKIKLDKISKINFIADQLIKLGTFLRVIEQVPQKLDIDKFIGSAKHAGEKYNRQRAALIEDTNAELRNKTEMTFEDIEKTIESVVKLEDYRRSIFTLNEEQLSSLEERDSSRSTESLVQARSGREIDEKKSMEATASINVAGVNVQIIPDTDRREERRNAITPETSFSTY